MILIHAFACFRTMIPLDIEMLSFSRIAMFMADVSIQSGLQTDSTPPDSQTASYAFDHFRRPA
jgi:hypothetical protein